MGVLRKGSKQGTIKPTGGEIIVKCPKCQEEIHITGPNDNNEPIRCGNCAYPMIRRSDLLRIVEACRKKPADAAQALVAFKILIRMADYVPEAGTALGVLANHYTLSMTDWERWNRLVAAYAGGDENAREWLNRMCQSNPGTYKQENCSQCGAPKYYTKDQQGTTRCIFCHSTD